MNSGSQDEKIFPYVPWTLVTRSQGTYGSIREKKHAILQEAAHLRGTCFGIESVKTVENFDPWGLSAPSLPGH